MACQDITFSFEQYGHNLEVNSNFFSSNVNTFEHWNLSSQVSSIFRRTPLTFKGEVTSHGMWEVACLMKHKAAKPLDILRCYFLVVFHQTNFIRFLRNSWGYEKHRSLFEWFFCSNLHSRRLCRITYYTTSHIAHVTTEVTYRTWKLQIHVTPATSSRNRRVAWTQGLNLDPMGNLRLSCLRPE